MILFLGPLLDQDGSCEPNMRTTLEQDLTFMIHVELQESFAPAYRQYKLQVQITFF